MSGPWEQYQEQSGPWEKYGAPPPSPPVEGAFSRFMTRATGLPASDIAAHPGKYLNPLSAEYWHAAKANANQPVGPSSVRQMIPLGQTAKDIGEGNYAGALGDVTPGALAAIQALGGFRPSSGIPLTTSSTRMLPETSAPITIEGRPSPSAAMSMAELRGRLLPETAGGKIPLPASTAEVPRPEVPAESEASYPGGLQKRPTDRAEIVSDKAIQDSMRNNLEQHGWQALSQERKEFFANNGPQLGKADLIAQARAEAIRAEAEQRAQQVLAEAANPTVKLTKMPKAKVPAAAKAQPVTEELNSPNRLVDLMQQSIDLINSRKGK